MRLAITPGAARTPAQDAFIREEQRREAIFEAVARLNCGEAEAFLTFNTPFVNLDEKEQEQLQSLGVNCAKYTQWESEYAQYLQRVPQSAFGPQSLAA